MVVGRQGARRRGGALCARGSVRHPIPSRRRTDGARAGTIIQYCCCSRAHRCPHARAGGGGARDETRDTLSVHPNPEARAGLPAVTATPARSAPAGARARAERAKPRKSARLGVAIRRRSAARFAVPRFEALSLRAPIFDWLRARRAGAGRSGPWGATGARRVRPHPPSDRPADRPETDLDLLPLAAAQRGGGGSGGGS